MDVLFCTHDSSMQEAQVRTVCPVLCDACSPPPNASLCTCTGIALDTGEGGSSCTSIFDGRRYCYVAAGACPDGVESVIAAGFHFSFLACQNVQSNFTSGPKGKESGNSAIDSLHKHPIRTTEIVGIVLGFLLLCGLVYQTVVQRRSGSPDGGGSGGGGGGGHGRGNGGGSLTVSSFENGMYDATLDATPTTAIADEGLYDEPPPSGANEFATSSSNPPASGTASNERPIPHEQPYANAGAGSSTTNATYNTLQSTLPRGDHNGVTSKLPSHADYAGYEVTAGTTGNTAAAHETLPEHSNDEYLSVNA